MSKCVQHVVVGDTVLAGARLDVHADSARIGTIRKSPACQPAPVAHLRWVSGGDGERVVITAKRAACWSAGEKHAAGSDTGMTAIALEGNDFTVAANELLP